ncbi:E3 ubiquitin-protein ligase MARCHF4-like isoform X2 [Cetorhinus maximus]
MSSPCPHPRNLIEGNARTECLSAAALPVVVDLLCAAYVSRDLSRTVPPPGNKFDEPSLHSPYGNNILPEGDLLSPCRCAGSVRCTHQPCLIKWISERGSWSCELCYYKYHVIAISAKNPLQWQAISLTVIERVQIAAAILGSLFLIASISWLIWSTISPSAKWQRQDLLFQICYGMYGFMDIVCIGLIIHEGPSVYRIFKRWQAVNQQWKVLNYEKSKDMEDQKSGTNRNRNSRAERSSTTHNSSRGNRPLGTMSNHHCAYTILHILSHLRSNEQRHQTSASRELVMRVTTV